MLMNDLPQGQLHLVKKANSRLYQWITGKEVPNNAPELLVPFEAKAGDILVMDGRVWHTSGSNITKDQDRMLRAQIRRSQ